MHSSQVVAKESAHGQTGEGPGVQWKANAPHPICSCTSFLNSSWRQVPVRRQLAKGEESFFLGLRKGSRDNGKKKGKWVTPPVPDRSLFLEWKFTQASKWLYLGSQETEKLPHIKTKEKSKGLERRLDSWILFICSECSWVFIPTSVHFKEWQCDPFSCPDQGEFLHGCAHITILLRGQESPSFQNLIYLHP